MAKDGLFLTSCAGALVGALLLIAATPALGSEPSNGIAATLAVQTALQQGRDLTLRGNYQIAVHVLEAQLSRINGSREYLTVLRDAYRGLVKELRLAGQDAQAQVYYQRLLILDPGSARDAGLRGKDPAPIAMPVPQTVVAPAAPAAPAGKVEDPFREFHARHGKTRGLVERAEQEFAARRYEDACRLFEQAHQEDPASTSAAREQWAYCKFFQVVRQLNEPPATGLPAPELEKEVRRAMSLAPRLEGFGNDLLRKIAEQTAGARLAPGAGDAGPAIQVRHGERTADGWSIAESANFRIYHNQPRDSVERAAEAAERARVEMSRKWLGDVDPTWSPRCDLYLHATGQDYSRATSVPASSPGHSTLRTEGSRVVFRRIDLHCDDPNLLTAVLPHETTHVVLAGKFGDQPVPRWADEGMAVLAEPRDRVERYLRNLPRHRADGQLFALHQLLQLNDYPEPRRVGAFYAQSVSLVEFLAGERGPLTFTRFVRDGMRSGYEGALKRHYGFQDFRELEQHWRRFALKEDPALAGAAERVR